MKRQTRNRSLLPIIACSLALFSSHRSLQARQPQDDTAWLKGSVDNRLHTVAGHLRGFKMTMVETGHVETAVPPINDSPD